MPTPRLVRLWQDFSEAQSMEAPGLTPLKSYDLIEHNFMQFVERGFEKETIDQHLDRAMKALDPESGLQLHAFLRQIATEQGDTEHAVIQLFALPVSGTRAQMEALLDPTVMESLRHLFFLSKTCSSDAQIGLLRTWIAPSALEHMSLTKLARWTQALGQFSKDPENEGAARAIHLLMDDLNKEADAFPLDSPRTALLLGVRVGSQDRQDAFCPDIDDAERDVYQADWTLGCQKLLQHHGITAHVHGPMPIHEALLQASVDGLSTQLDAERRMEQHGKNSPDDPFDEIHFCVVPQGLMVSACANGLVFGPVSVDWMMIYGQAEALHGWIEAAADTLVSHKAPDTLPTRLRHRALH